MTANFFETVLDPARERDVAFECFADESNNEMDTGESQGKFVKLPRSSPQLAVNRVSRKDADGLRISSQERLRRTVQLEVEMPDDPEAQRLAAFARDKLADRKDKQKVTGKLKRQREAEELKAAKQIRTGTT